MSTPPRIVQGSVVFAVDGERVLLLQRNHQPFAGKWDGLQGLVEFGETPKKQPAAKSRRKRGWFSTGASSAGTCCSTMLSAR